MVREGSAATAAAEDDIGVFLGKIVKDGDHLILRTSDGATYQLDEQRNLSQYQDKNVRIHGTLDGNTIRVVKIELLS